MRWERKQKEKRESESVRNDFAPAEDFGFFTALKIISLPWSLSLFCCFSLLLFIFRASSHCEQRCSSFFPLDCFFFLYSSHFQNAINLSLNLNVWGVLYHLDGVKQNHSVWISLKIFYIKSDWVWTFSHTIFLHKIT